MKKAKIILATAVTSLVALVVWIIIDIVLLAKDDAFSFDVFDDYQDI